MSADVEGALPEKASPRDGGSGSRQILISLGWSGAASLCRQSYPSHIALCVLPSCTLHCCTTESFWLAFAHAPPSCCPGVCVDLPYQPRTSRASIRLVRPDRVRPPFTPPARPLTPPCRVEENCPTPKIASSPVRPHKRGSNPDECTSWCTSLLHSDRLEDALNLHCSIPFRICRKPSKILRHISIIHFLFPLGSSCATSARVSLTKPA